MGFDYAPMPTPWRNFKPIRKSSSGKVNTASIAPVTKVFPLAKLDRAISFSITRPASSRTTQEKNEQEEILTFNKIAYDDRNYVRFDVFLNVDKTVNADELDKAEFAGSYTSLPHVHGSNTNHVTSVSFRLAITELLEDIGLEDEDTIAVTLVPKAGGEEVSLLSTAAVVFTVASIYTSKPVSFSSTLAAIPSVFKRLFITFIWVSLSMLAYNTVFLIFLVLLIVAADTQNVVLFLFSFLVVFILFLVVHVYFSALWHLASVVSVLEPIYGIGAMKKSYQLLKGKTGMAFFFVFGYLSICGVINGFFGSVVVHGGDNYGVVSRILIGGFLVGVLVIVNLVGLLMQSVFYYVCKSYHHQEIDKTALYDHLGGYLGEYVPLKSSVQMENLEGGPSTP